jgi:hypothetical protein
LQSTERIVNDAGDGSGGLAETCCSHEENDEENDNEVAHKLAHQYTTRGEGWALHPKSSSGTTPVFRK